jgi:hypothetical protein
MGVGGGRIDRLSGRIRDIVADDEVGADRRWVSLDNLPADDAASSLLAGRLHAALRGFGDEERQSAFGVEMVDLERRDGCNGVTGPPSWWWNRLGARRVEVEVELGGCGSAEV